MIARLWDMFTTWLAFTFLASGAIVGAAALGELIGRAIVWLRRYRARGVALSPTLNRSVVEAAAKVLESVDEEDDDLPLCPACIRMCALRQRYPKLTVDQVDAIVRRQIALGTCRPHAYADAPD